MLSLGLLGVVALLATAWPRPSMAATTTTAPDRSNATEGTTLELVSQTVWLQAGGSVQVRVVLPARTDRTTARLAVTVHRPVTSRTQFDATLERQRLGSTVLEVTRPIAELPSAGDEVTLTLGPEELAPVHASVGGAVLPMTVDLEGGATTTGFVSHLVRVPDSTPTNRLQVSWSPTVTAPVTTAEDGARRVSAEGLEQLRTLVGALGTAALTTTLVLDVDVLDALDSDPEAADVVDALGALARRGQVVTRGYGDVEPGALLDAGLDDLDLQRSTAAATVSRVLGVSVDESIWVDDVPVDERGVQALVDGGTTTVVLDETSYRPITRSITLASPFSLDLGDGRRVEAAAADTTLGARFTDDADQLDATHLLAELAVLYFDRPGQLRGVAMVPAASSAPSSAFLETLAAGLASSPILQTVTVTGLFDVDPETSGDTPLVRQLVEGEASPESPIDGDAVRAARAGLDDLSSLTTSLDQAPFDRLVLASEGRGLDVADRQGLLDVVHARVRSVTTNVVVDHDSYRLTARDGVIPLTITNRSGTSLTVALDLAADELSFDEGGSDVAGSTTQVVELRDVQTSVQIQVSVRAPGAFLTFPLTVTVRSLDDRVVLSRSTVTVRSTAVSGVGVALSVVALAFLLLWWGREWRRGRARRRDRHGVATATSGSA